MSHFTVIVIGPNVEKQLAPYHEFECTGLDDEFVKDLDVTESVRAEFVKYADEGQTFAQYVEGDGKSIVPFGTSPDLSGEHKYGYALVDKAGEVVKVVDRTNPGKKWDWWVVGGRWSGFFPLKDGTHGTIGRPGVFDNKPAPRTADACRWGDVDIVRARREASEAARASFAKWSAAVEACGRPDSWTTVREAHNGDHDKARKVYNAQPAIAAMRDVWGCPAETYGFDEATYVAKESARALVPFAVVKDGAWHEKGEMGWFACVSNEKEQGDWNAQVAVLLDSLDPDTLVTLVDCHI